GFSTAWVSTCASSFSTHVLSQISFSTARRLAQRARLFCDVCFRTSCVSTCVPSDVSFTVEQNHETFSPNEPPALPHERLLNSRAAVSRSYTSIFLHREFVDRSAPVLLSGPQDRGRK